MASVDSEYHIYPDDPREGWPPQAELDALSRKPKKPDFERARFGRHRPWLDSAELALVDAAPLVIEARGNEVFRAVEVSTDHPQTRP